MIYKQAVKIGKGSVLTGLHILYKKYMEWDGSQHHLFFLSSCRSRLLFIIRFNL